MGRQFTEVNLPQSKELPSDDLDPSNNSQEVPDEIREALDAALNENYATKLVVPFVINELSFINSLSSCLEASEEYNSILGKLSQLSAEELEEHFFSEQKTMHSKGFGNGSEVENDDSDSDCNDNDVIDAGRKISNDSEDESLEEESVINTDESDYDRNISNSDEEDNLNNSPEKFNLKINYNSGSSRSDFHSPDYQSSISNLSAPKKIFPSVAAIKPGSSDFSLPPPLILQGASYSSLANLSEIDHTIDSATSLNVSMLLAPMRSSSPSSFASSFSVDPLSPLKTIRKRLDPFHQTTTSEACPNFALSTLDFTDHEKNLSSSSDNQRKEDCILSSSLHVTDFHTNLTPQTPKKQKLSDLYLKSPSKTQYDISEDASYILDDSNSPYNTSAVSYSLFYEGSPNQSEKTEKDSNVSFNLDDYKIKREDINDDQMFQKYDYFGNKADTSHSKDDSPKNAGSPTQYQGSSDSFDSLSDDYEISSGESDDQLEISIPSKPIRADKGKGITKNKKRKSKISFLNMSDSELMNDSEDLANMFEISDTDDFDSDFDKDGTTLEDCLTEIQDLYSDYYQYIHNIDGPIKFAPEDVINRDLQYMDCFSRHLENFKVVPKLNVFERNTVLEDQFYKTPRLNKQQVKDLAEQTGLSEKSIRIWFANKRSRTKKEK